MDYTRLHDWDLSPSEAVALQKELRERVILRPLPDDVELVGGVDVSYNKFSDVIYVAIVVLRLPDLTVETTSGVVTTSTFPYIPGLLSFRETPPFLEAWEKLDLRPDVLMLDGQGIAHPRRFGIASHVGLLTGVPAIGCAKTVLVGKFSDLGEEAGSTAPMVDRGETVGAAVRTRDRINPVYVSPGHLADVESAATLALRCVRGYAEGRSRYRIPDPTRFAHLLVNAMRRGEEWTPPV